MNHGFLPRREVSKERGQQLASSLGISFREIHSEDDLAGINEVCARCRYLWLVLDRRQLGDFILRFSIDSFLGF